MITYDSETNTITVVGGSEDSPYTFEDIYQADVNGGWGKVKKQGEREYFLSANLQIGDGSTSTVFKETQKAIEINGEFKVKEESIAQFGEWDGHAKNGCYIYFAKLHTSLVYYDVFGTLKLYGCILFAKKQGTTQRIYIRARGGATTDYRESIFCDFRGLRFLNTDANVQDVKIRNVLYGYYVDSPLAHKWSGVFTDKTLSVAYTYGTIIIYNLETPRIEMYGSTSTLHLILVDAVNIIKPTIGSSNDECQLIYKYTTIIKVMDKDGNTIKDATVQIIDKDGNVVDTQLTDDDGMIKAEITSRRYYGQDETLDIRTPHTIKIEKDGYKTVEFIETIDKPINIEICLNPETISMSDILNELQEHRNTVEPKIDTTISSRASQDSVNAIPTNPLLDNDSRLDNLDATISSRLASNDSRLDNLDTTISSRSSHTPADVWSYSNRELTNPDNYKADVSDLAKESTVQSIKSQTDKLQFTVDNDVKATLDGEKVNLTDTTEAQIDNIESNVLNYDQYKADVSSLAKENTAQSIKSQTDKMQFTADNDIKATLDGEVVSLSTDTETQIDNIENNTNEIKQTLNNEVVTPLQRILGLSQENYILQPIEYNGSGQLTKGRIKIYQNSTDCSNEENEIASYYIEVEYLGDGRLSKYKVTKE